VSENEIPKKRKAAKPESEDDITCMPIEKCFEELEQIVSALENQTTSLEDSLKLFERGVKLSRRCSSELTAIENRIQLIIENNKGEVELKDFEPGEV
jgi:exodeoxyribonuclease VII small subunit